MFLFFVFFCWYCFCLLLYSSSTVAMGAHAVYLCLFIVVCSPLSRVSCSPHFLHFCSFGFCPFHFVLILPLSMYFCFCSSLLFCLLLCLELGVFGAVSVPRPGCSFPFSFSPSGPCWERAADEGSNRAAKEGLHARSTPIPCFLYRSSCMAADCGGFPRPLCLIFLFRVLCCA